MSYPSSQTQGGKPIIHISTMGMLAFTWIPRVEAALPDFTCKIPNLLHEECVLHLIIVAKDALKPHQIAPQTGKWLWIHEKEFPKGERAFRTYVRMRVRLAL